MSERDTHAIPALAGRGTVGGVLMGLANLVPGISGGTMLLAAGVYPQFIRGVAEISTFRFRLRSMVLVACVVAGAIAIVALAEIVRDLVVHHQWVMNDRKLDFRRAGDRGLGRGVKPSRGQARAGRRREVRPRSRPTALRVPMGTGHRS